MIFSFLMASRKMMAWWSAVAAYKLLLDCIAVIWQGQQAAAEILVYHSIEIIRWIARSHR